MNNLDTRYAKDPGKRRTGSDPLVTDSYDADGMRHLDRAFALEQVKTLRHLMARTQERIDEIAVELKSLSWKWARLLRDCRLALATARSDLADASQREHQARLELQAATEALHIADTEFAPRRWDRWALAAGILNQRMRARKGAMLDRHMQHAMACAHLRAAIEHCGQYQLAAEARHWELTELWERRRRERSLLNQETQILQRQYQRDKLQCEHHVREMGSLEAANAALHEDVQAPA